MKDDIRYIDSYLVCRDIKTGVGYEFDFMVLLRNNESYPYINIYYFHNKTNEHIHYIIDIEGKLEVAHRDYKKEWIEKEKIFPK